MRMLCAAPCSLRFPSQNLVYILLLFTTILHQTRRLTTALALFTFLYLVRRLRLRRLLFLLYCTKYLLKCPSRRASAEHWFSLLERDRNKLRVYNQPNYSFCSVLYPEWKEHLEYKEWTLLLFLSHAMLYRDFCGGGPMMALPEGMNKIFLNCHWFNSYPFKWLLPVCLLPWWVIQTDITHMVE